MKIAFFDFDGTVSNKDSLIKFIRYAVGDLKTALGILFLSPMLIIFKLKLVPNYKAKELMFSYFFKGMSEQEFKKIAKEYSLQHINNILRKKAIEKIEWHKDKGHVVVIVSASIECWLKPWCDENNIELIATKIEIINATITGKFFTKNCYGIEKVNRINEIYNLNNYNYIYSYGDSSGDKELLEIADESFYKPFR